MDTVLEMEIEMPQNEQVAPEVVPLPSFLRTLTEGLRANEEIDKDLIAILETHIINVEHHDKSGAEAANAIEKLATRRVEGDHAS